MPLVTGDRIRELCGNHPVHADEIAAGLEASREKYEVTTDLRVAHLMAQLATESARFTRLEENLSYSAQTIAADWKRLASRAEELAHKPEALANAAYASHLDAQENLVDPLGNGAEATGNGWRYRGRGLIQLTGLANYRSFAAAIGEDLVGNPDLAAALQFAPEIALAFWKSRRCNAAADSDNVDAVTRLINGGHNGIEERRELTTRAKLIFVET